MYALGEHIFLVWLIIEYVKPTALLGLSTMKGAFNQNVVEAIAGLNHRLIVFPFSNPVSLSKCTYDEALEWSQGSVIFASGSPFLEVKYNGVQRYPGQGNNILTDAERAEDRVYPDLTRIREISVQIAHRVVRVAQESGFGRHAALRSMDEAVLMEGRMWQP